MNTKVLIALLSPLLLLCVPPAQGKNREKSFQFVLGPVEISPEQTLKLCSTDLSSVLKMKEMSKKNELSSGSFRIDENPNRVVRSSTRVEVFDSSDTNQPLPVEINDIVYNSGEGGCVSVLGYDINIGNEPRSVIIMLTTITEARSTFNPIVSGQIRASGGEPTCCALLLPAVQKVL